MPSDPHEIHSYEDVISLCKATHRAIIVQMLKEIPRLAQNDSLPAWTKAVKDVAESALRSNINEMWEFYGTRKVDGDFKSREWLVDAAWYIRTTQAQGIFLALESEWKHHVDEVVNDFCKLLALKSPLKIILFEASKKEAEEYIEGLNDVGRKWLQHTTGDTIYAIDFSRGTHRTWFCEIQKDGTNASFALKPVAELSKQTA